MNRVLLAVVISIFSIVYFSGVAFAGAPETISFNNISKIYIEYENGQSQVFELSTPINYSFNLDDGYTYTTGSSQTLISGQLNQDSNISKIALWMESITMDDEITSLGGYYGLNRENDPADFEAWPTGYTNISSWFTGSFSSGTNGIVNFNSSISGTDLSLTVLAGNSFSARDKTVNIRFKAYVDLIGSDIQTEDL